MEFILKLSEENLSNIQIYIGEFSELIKEYHFAVMYYKEHPLNLHYKGVEESRDWLFEVKGFYPSFFSFWKKCKKELGY